PAVATLVMMRAQLQWLLANGGMEFAATRTADSSGRVYSWADNGAHTETFVTESRFRSPVVSTIDFSDNIDAAELRSVLRAHGVVDIDPYRKLGRNQIRVGVFPAVVPEDVSALIACLDYVMEQMAP